MSFAKWTGNAALFLVVAVLTTSIGCTQKEKSSEQQAKAKDAKADDGKKELKADIKHETWWCEEHGVPEGICSLCSDKNAAKFKKEGDWCKIHDRAQSQCFKCDPSKYAKYEAMYEAKYGKKPPRPPESEFAKN
jgi:hypothetical protein